MSDNKMLIDAAHPEETRVVVLRGGRVEEFDYESAARKQLRGNIYLAKVTRVEPALQAAFVDYGGNRHGFLAFNEIHPDYYQIPMADRLALLEEEAAEAVAEDDDDDLEAEASSTSDASDETSGDEDESDDDGLNEEPVDLDEIVEDEDDTEIDPTAADADADDSDAVEAAPENTDVETAAETVSTQAADTDEASGDAEAATASDEDAPDSGEPDENGDDRPTVLTQSMQRDELLSEEFSSEQSDTAPALEPAEVSEAPEAVADETPRSEATDDQSDAPQDEVTEAVAENVDESSSVEAETQSDEEAPADGEAPDAPVAADGETIDADVATDGDAPEVTAELEAADAEEAASDDSEQTETDKPTSRRSRGGRRRRSSGRGGSDRRRTRGRRRSNNDDDSADEAGEPVEQVGNGDALEELPSRPRRSRRSYKIQEVVKRRQVLLIQVVKEERGNKGAALTTYLSLAGRYTVLMPNTARGGGISRKITTPQDRKRLKAIAAELDVPEGMGLIIRTAGAARTKQEIKRDFEYLLRLWESVRELTLQSTAPALVYEEGDLIKRSIRDLYNKDVDQVLVAGNDAYRSAKNFMRMLMPSHAKHVINYDDPEPLFTRHGIERQLNAMFSPYVHLPSGGYLVINQTEALVAIDVNSGRSTREFSIEETALNTNLEAADEVARQLKLRDLAGLVVVDFIDMDERRNNRNVERRMRDALREDRARIQVGRISPFGLLEMSRQRLRTGVLEGSTSPCPHCQGTGIIRSVESVALAVLRGLEDTVMGGCRHALIAYTTAEVALYILNNKREFVIAMEQRLGMPIAIKASSKMVGANYTIEKGDAPAAPIAKPRADAISVDFGFDDEDQEPTQDAEAASDDDKQTEGRSRRRRRRRGGRRSGERAAAEADNAQNEDESTSDAVDDTIADEAAISDADVEAAEDDGQEEKTTRRRRRGRRGGRRNRSRNRDAEMGDNDNDEEAGEQPIAAEAEDDVNADSEVTEPAIAEPSVNADEATESNADISAEATNEASDSAEATSDSDDTGSVQESQAEPAVTASSLVTPIHIGTPDENSAVQNEAQSQQGSDPAPQAAVESDPASEEPVKKRSRGEPVSSAPRVEHITVSPDGEPNTSANGSGDQAESETAEVVAEKPARRGWWQRSLLGKS
ncbi:MAG: Rne/Rng family ribonuclease [Filomicrobium sp.]